MIIRFFVAGEKLSKGVSPRRSNALSKLRGEATHPKDFSWHADNVPCQAACPANTDVPEYLRAIHLGGLR